MSFIMSSILIISFLNLFIFGCTMSNAESPKGIFILAGQSNMAGMGALSPPFPENSPDPSTVFRLAADHTWVVAQDPLHGDIDSGAGVGPGMSFANAVKKHIEPVGLVPCATSGSEIKQWVRGKPYYDNMVNRAKSALSGGELKAFLWYQGESDTNDVDNYRANLENLIKNVREDLSSPSLPTIVVAIASAGPNGNPQNVENLRKIQMSIQLPNVAHVDARGLELQSDQLHLTTKGQVQLGQMLAQEYLTKFAA